MIKKYFSNPANTLRLLVILIAGVTLVACASMGRPEGGHNEVAMELLIRRIQAHLQEEKDNG